MSISQRHGSGRQALNRTKSDTLHFHFVTSTRAGRLVGVPARMERHNIIGLRKRGEINVNSNATRNAF